jgi:hypothetical protein
MTVRAGYTLDQEPAATGRNGNVDAEGLPAVRAIMLGQAVSGPRHQCFCAMWPELLDRTRHIDQVGCHGVSLGHQRRTPL